MSGKLELIVTVEEARNLIAADATFLRRSAKSDPYAVLQLGDEKAKTPVDSNTCDPTWGFRHVFGEKRGLRGDMLVVTLKDKDVDRDDDLGVAKIPIASLASHDGPVTHWYRLEATAGMKAVKGDVRLSLELVGDKASLLPSPHPAGAPGRAAETDASVAAGAGAGAGSGAAGAEKSSVPGAGGKHGKAPTPNVLVVVVLRAHGLKSADTLGKSDPYVTVSVGDVFGQTKTMSNTIDPRFNEKFRFPVSDGSTKCVVDVFDEDLGRDEFLGRVEFEARDFASGVSKRTFAVRDKAGKVSRKFTGELELEVQWVFSDNVPSHGKKGLFSSRRSRAVSEMLIVEDTDEEGAEVVDDDDKGEAPTPEELKKSAEEQKKALAKLRAQQLRGGDYQVQVHIIEVRDLKPEDLEGTSDPIVFVDVMGQRQHTRVRKGVKSAIFDDLFMFPFKNLAAEDVDVGMIKVSVFDADTFSRNDLIGSFAMDLQSIYYREHHEMWHQWVALTDDGNPEDTGVQGYLKLSVAVIGPGDVQYIHDEQEDDEAAEVGSDITSLILMPPSVERSLHFLVVTAFRGLDIQPMDRGSLFSKPGIDAFVQVDFAGDKPARTRYKSLKMTKGATGLAPVWNQELWCPVTFPTMANTIRIRVYDHDTMRPNELLATTHVNFSLVTDLGGLGPQWYNLYGPPRGVHGKHTSRMAKSPAAATHFVGRILLSFREVAQAYVGKLQQPKYPEAVHTSRVEGLTNAQFPPVARYSLNCAVLAGAELPKSSAVRNLVGGKHLSVRVSIGPYTATTSHQDNEDGEVEWTEMLALSDISLPDRDLELPDVFVYLVRGKTGQDRLGGDPICFARIPARTLLNDGYQAKSRWVSLEEDKAIDALGDLDSPGSLLLGLELSRSDKPPQRTQADWEADMARLRTRQEHQLRVHVYQAKELPPSDSNGLLDPYVRVRFGGQSCKTTTKLKTRNPLFYETLCLHVSTPPLELAPDVVVEVLDWDRLSKDDLVGRIRFSLADPRLIRRRSDSDPLSRPIWFPVEFGNDSSDEGHILLSFELVDTAARQAPPALPDLRPDFRPAFVDITALGLRDMKGYQMQPLNMPYCEFSVGVAKTAGQAKCTLPSNRPSGSNPNFGERIVVPVQLPEDPLFCPSLDIRVIDKRLGGFSRPLVAATSISLVDLLPWSPTFRPSAARARSDTADGQGEEEEKSDPATAPAQPADPEDVTGDVGLEPAYMRGRRDLAHKLEADLGPPPFKTYPLFRGQKRGVSGLFGGVLATTYEQVGHFKGLIRVVESADTPPVIDLAKFLRPQPCEVRLYVLRGMKFMTLDDNGKSDPFLEVSLGNKTISDLDKGRAGYVKDSTDPPLYRVYRFPTTIPGPSELRIRCLDYDALGRNDPLGKTVVDVEDRWFSDTWQRLGEEEETATRLRPKPVETRALELPTSSNPQGQLKMWVDIVGQQDANKFPAIDISPPPPQEFEIRVVVWKCEDMTSMDDITNMNDLFVRGWVEDGVSPSPHQDTDVHWRSQNGKGSFNWRLVFKVKYPSKFCRLNMQVWDKDVAKWSDCIAETGLNLLGLLKQAHFSGKLVNPFAVQAGQAPSRAQAPSAVAPESASNTTSGKATPKTGATRRRSSRKSPHGRAARDNPEAAVPLISADYATYGANHEEAKRLGEVSEEEEEKSNEAGTHPLRAGAGAGAGADMSAGSGVSGKGTKSGSRRRRVAGSHSEHAEAEETIRGVKDLLGLSDPKDARWITLTRRDPESGATQRMGRMLVSLEVVPESLWGSRPAGLGRSEPNCNPFLPPPTGRVKLSANPCVMLEQLLGPRLCKQLAVGFCCVLILAAGIMGAPFLNSILQMGQLAWENPLTRWLCILVSSLFTLCLLSFCVWCCCLRASEDDDSTDEGGAETKSLLKSP